MKASTRWNLTIMLSIAFAGAGARAESWREFKRSDQLVGALNVGDARRTGSVIEVAMLLVPKAQPLAPVLVYTIIDIRADCTARTAQLLGSQNFAGAAPVGERTRADAAPTRSEGNGLDPLCNLSELQSSSAPTALDFARRAWTQD